MFDKSYITKGRTEYVPYEKSVTIIEKRAPTDESIRLLNEFIKSLPDELKNDFEMQLKYM